MTRLELEDLIQRARPFIGREIPWRWKNPETQKSEMANYTFILIGTATSIAEGGQENFRVPGILEPPTGKQLLKPLKRIVEAFEKALE